jgi:hypothetical protein
MMATILQQALINSFDGRTLILERTLKKEDRDG